MSLTDQTGERQGEVLISGLDTGPAPAERENISPTEELMLLSPETPLEEPEDEDG